MKQFPKLTLFFTLSIFFLLFNACENEPLDGGIIIDESNNNPTSTFTVDFDSQTFVADNIGATRTDDLITITGIRGANQETLVLTVYGVTEGTYQFAFPIGIEMNTAIYLESSNSTNFWMTIPDFENPGSLGTLIISEIDEVNMTMSGSFHFTVQSASSTETKEFTNGTFTNVSFQDGLINNNDNTFFANVDGNEFVEAQIYGEEATQNGNSTISISASKNNGEIIGLSFDTNITTGIYNFQGLTGSTNIGRYIGADPLHQYFADGEFTITNHDTSNNLIEGTFNFVATPIPGLDAPGMPNITDGEFSVSY
jgi:hypothetical protein